MGLIDQWWREAVEFVDSGRRSPPPLFIFHCVEACLGITLIWQVADFCVRATGDGQNNLQPFFSPVS